jgi:hypothetical protein
MTGLLGLLYSPLPRLDGASRTGICRSSSELPGQRTKQPRRIRRIRRIRSIEHRDGKRHAGRHTAPPTTPLLLGRCEQLVGQLRRAAVAVHTAPASGLHIAAHRLAIHRRQLAQFPLTDRPAIAVGSHSRRSSITPGRSCREYSDRATGSLEATPGGPTNGKPVLIAEEP